MPSGSDLSPSQTVHQMSPEPVKVKFCKLNPETSKDLQVWGWDVGGGADSADYKLIVIKEDPDPPLSYGVKINKAQFRKW